MAASMIFPTTVPAPSCRPLHRYPFPKPPTAALLDPPFPYGEDLLQFIWASRLVGAGPLFTTDGRRLEVLAPGRIQRNSGPDMEGAEVRIDGQRWVGTIEVHLRSSDWNAHGHQFDPAYNNVVLHVVHEHDAEVRTVQGVVPPTLELKDRVPPASIALHAELMRSRRMIPCAGRIAEVDPLRLSTWLERVLVERIEQKAQAVDGLHQRLGSDPAATLYHVLARAFGMKVNAEPFAMLALALPWRVLARYLDDTVRTEALLFGQAGLLQVPFLEAHPRALQVEHDHLRRLHGLRPMPMAAWKFARMRPMNFPTVRIAHFARFLHMHGGSLTTLLEIGHLDEARRVFQVDADAYWNDHYRLDVPAAASVKRVGRAAADHLIVNGLVPALFSLGRHLGRPAWRERAMRWLEELPPERNHLLADWSELGVMADSAARAQALLELRNSYCARHRCLSCAVGNQLMQRSVLRS